MLWALSVFYFLLHNFCFCLIPILINFFVYFFFFTHLAIKSALKQENLNPEIEEKLLILQRYQEKQMLRQESDHTSHVTPKIHHPQHTQSTTSSILTSSRTITSRKRPPSASRTNEDADWVMETPKRSRPTRTTELRKIIEPEVQ